MEQFLKKYLLRDLYAPHPRWGFDGPYTRLQMEDGSSFIFIMSSVWKAKSRPHLSHLSYTPLPSMKASSGSNEVEAFACDFYPNAMGVTRRKQDDREGVAAYTLSAILPEQNASFKLDVYADRQTYHHAFTHPKTRQKLFLDVEITENTPHSLLGPMWIGRFLPVPLKWQVFSTRSKATVTISEGDRILLRKAGLAHQEKNWGIGSLAAIHTRQKLMYLRISQCLDLVSRIFYSSGKGLPCFSRRNVNILPQCLHACLSLAYNTS